MRERGGYITCAVATANGFAQPYRAKIVVHQDKPESGLDFDGAARRSRSLPDYVACLKKPTLTPE